MKTIVFVALLAAAGCSKQASDCETSINKGMDNFAASVKTAGLNPAMQTARMDVVTKLRTTLTQRCNEDKWPAEVVSCFTTVATMKEMQACQSKLSNEQRTKLVGEIRQIMMGAMRMPNGVPGHPSTLAPGGAGSAAPDGSGGMAGSHPDPAAGSAAPASGSAPATPPAPPAAGSGAAPSPGAPGGSGQP
jgi:hypothetical protein